MAHELVVKEMRGFVKAHAEPFDVFDEASLCVGCQPHHRVLQKREMPHDPVVGTKRNVEGHLWRERKEKSRKVGRHREVAREHRVRKNPVVARRHVVARLALLDAEISRRRYDVEAALRSGKVRAIGLSNFYPDHFVDMAECATVKPAVNQLQTNVFRQQWDADHGLGAACAGKSRARQVPASLRRSVQSRTTTLSSSAFHLSHIAPIGFRAPSGFFVRGGFVG